MTKKPKGIPMAKRWEDDDDYGLSEPGMTFEDAAEWIASRQAGKQHDSDADDATTRVGKTRGAMAKERGQAMQNMTAARVKNVTAAAGSTGFEKNTTLKGHKASSGRAFRTAKTVK